MKVIELYTDGGCAPTNPGPGVCAYAIVNKDVLGRFATFKFDDATSNIMELTAIIKGLTYCKNKYPGYKVIVYTDSQYVQQGLTLWVHRWLKNDWKNSKGKTVANIPLWKKLLSLNRSMVIECRWIKGHNGNVWNEFVDNLCKQKT